MMKKILFTLLSFLTLAAPALAGDISLLPTGESSPWTGKYIISAKVGDSYPDAPSGDWFAVDYDDSGWTECQGPISNDANFCNINTLWTIEKGSCWVRRTFNLSELPSENAVLVLRVISDDRLQVYINGTLVSKSGFTQSYKDIAMSSEFLRVGKNVVAARCDDDGGSAWIDFGLSVKTGVENGVFYEVTGDSATVTGCCSVAVSNLNIPATVTIDGQSYKVTSIANEAFSNNQTIQSVNIAVGVKSIGKDAFRDSHKLMSVTLSASVISIGESAFKGCPSLTSITIPKNVTSIGPDAFTDCTGISSISVDEESSTFDSRENCNAIIETATNTLVVGCANTTIPSSVTGIGFAAFSGCQGISAITLPDNLTSIGDYAFHYTSLTSINIPEGVTSIGEGTFWGCGNLNSIVLPKGVKSIGYNAFALCSGLTSLPIPTSVTSIGRGAFCTSGITSITIPKGVTSIGSWAFWECFDLTEIYAKMVTPPTIDESVFGRVDKTTCTLYVPEGSVDAYKAADGWKDFENIVAALALEGDVSLLPTGESTPWTGKYIISAKVGDSYPDAPSGDWFAIDYDDSGWTECQGPISNAAHQCNVNTQWSIEYGSCWVRRTFTLSELPSDSAVLVLRATSDDEYQLYINGTLVSASKLYGYKNIVVSPELLRVGKNVVAARCDDSGGHEAYIDFGLSLVKGVVDGTIYEVDGIFYEVAGDSATVTGCSIAVTNLNIPATVTIDGQSYNVTSIADKAFDGNHTIQSMNIATGITYIGESAFSDCNNLTEVNLPEGLKTIEAFAFAGYRPTSITIPESVENIGPYAFAWSGLTSISLPASLKELNWYVFWCCRNLTSVAIKGLTGITPPAQNAFAYCPLSEITVDSSNTKYDSRDNCNAIIETATNTLIVGCASTTIPSSVTGITENAFIFCEHLTSITIPSNVTNIAGTTFPNCPNLTSIIVDENNPVYDSRDNCNAIIETATNTFISGCKNSIIPNSVTSIAKYAFCCNGLTSITIPKGVTSIGERAFKEKWNEIHAQMTTPSTIDGTAFEGVDKSTCILYVPEGSVDAYKAADVWKDFENIVAEQYPDTDISGFDNILYAPTLEVRPGQQAMLSICLKNAVDISSFGFRLFLPEGVSIAWSEEDNDYAINLNPSRASLKRFTTSFAEQTDGSMLIICYSTQNHSFVGNDGEVINILLDIADEMADGEYPIYINHQEMATASMTTFNVAQCKSTLTVLSYLLGDVNGDQQVSVVDINGVVNLILGTNTNGLLVKAADTNCDGSISVVDINGVVNIILYGNPMGPSPAPALRGKWATEPAAIRMDDVLLCNGRTALVGLTVEGVAGTYSSMQFDVLLPEGITMDVKSDNHHLVCTALQDDGTTRVVCTSLSNHPFTGNTPLTISLTADEAAEGDYALTLTHIELASPHLTTTHPADYTAALRVHGTTGINMLNASDGQPLYNLQGIRMEGGSNMEKGVFIQNNKKIFKK